MFRVKGSDFGFRVKESDVGLIGGWIDWIGDGKMTVIQYSRFGEFS